MAILVLFPAPARARVIATGSNRALGILGLHQVHELPDGLTRLSERGESLQVGLAVFEKTFQARAKIVQPSFALWSLDEAILWASPVAHREDWAFAAVARQRVLLLAPEFSLRWAVQHLGQRSLADVSNQVFRIDEMVAGIKVPVMFEDGEIAAGLPKDTERMFLP